MNIYAVILVAVVAYLGVAAIGRRIGLWKRLRVTFYGPVMLIRTERGRKLMNRVSAPRKLWSTYGTAAVVVVLLATALVIWLLISTLVDPNKQWFPLETRQAPPHSDPVLMFAYMSIALGFAVIIHEFAHGILSIVSKVRVDSMGILLLLIPIGAFVEPNESELKRAPRAGRLRLFAAGPAANVFLGAFCFALLVLFLSPSAVPMHPEGAVITEVTRDSPAYVSGIVAWTEVSSVGGMRIHDGSSFTDFTFERPGELVTVNLTHDGRDTVLALPGGVAVTRVADGPALNAGISPGMIISSLNDVEINSLPELTSTIERAPHDKPVNITVMRFGGEGVIGGPWFHVDPRITIINLTSKWLYYYTHYPSLNIDEFKNLSTMGISASPFGAVVVDPDVPIQGIAHPFAGVGSAPALLQASVDFLGQPFLGHSPVDGSIADLYEPSGVLSALPHDIYWLLVNVFYWVFWTNIVLGISNALPMLPMDGGLVLTDLLKGLAHRSGEKLTELDRAIGRRPVTDKQIDHLMVAVTVIVSVLFVYLLVSSVF